VSTPESPAEAHARPARATPLVLLVPAIALALALAVWWSTPRLGALGAYEMEVVSPPRAVGTLAPTGREPALPIALRPGDELSLVLQPRSTSVEPVEASVFVQAGGSSGGPALAPVPAVTRDAGRGILRVTVSGAALPEAGRLLVLVGRRGLLPGNPVGTASHGRDWQRFDLDFRSAAPVAR
jgi:hypothetical protein